MRRVLRRRVVPHRRENRLVDCHVRGAGSCRSACKYIYNYCSWKFSLTWCTWVTSAFVSCTHNSLFIGVRYSLKISHSILTCLYNMHSVPTQFCWIFELLGRRVRLKSSTVHSSSSSHIHWISLQCQNCDYQSVQLQIPKGLYILQDFRIHVVMLPRDQTTANYSHYLYLEWILLSSYTSTACRPSFADPPTILIPPTRHINSLRN